MSKAPVVDLSKLPENTNEVYIPYYNNDNRYLVIFGGAGSGKSRFIGQKHLYRVLTQNNHRFLVIRKVATTLRPSVFQLFVDYIYRWHLDKIFKINKSDMRITNIYNGGEFLFYGLDDVEKLKSIEGITSIWIEEASEITEDDFTQLDLRLRGKTTHYKQIIISFNPISAEHWLKKYFFDRKVDDCSILKTTYLDNRFIDDRYKKVLNDLQYTNKIKYDIYALGNWGVLKGLIYDTYETIDEMPDVFDDECYGGDFGFNNPSAFVHVRVKEKNIYLDELLYEREMINAEIIERLNKNYPFLKKLSGYLDSAEPDRITEFGKAGFVVFPAKKSVKDGIDKVKEYKIHITKRSVNIIREINGYVWREDKDGNSMDEPVKIDDHSMDAKRYAVFTHLTKTGKTESFKVDFL